AIGQTLLAAGLQNLETGDRHDRPERRAVTGGDLDRDPSQVLTAHACLEMAVGVDPDGRFVDPDLWLGARPLAHPGQPRLGDPLVREPPQDGCGSLQSLPGLRAQLVRAPPERTARKAERDRGRAVDSEQPRGAAGTALVRIAQVDPVLVDLTAFNRPAVVRVS